MLPFATDFPVKNFSREQFVALTTGWLQGSLNCKLFEKDAVANLDVENASVVASDGEELKIQEFIGIDGSQAIGFRYDRPDNQGRRWRTELVISRTEDSPDESVVRARTQCIAELAGAKIESPKKPYILKAIIQDNKSSEDGYLTVQDVPHYLTEDSSSVTLAAEVVAGCASVHLPVVYVSCEGMDRYPLSKDQISKLAYDLGGVAHVLVEPSRDFSNSVREITLGSNAYGGSIGIYSPSAPRGKKFYIGGAIKNSNELLNWVFEYCFELRSRLPAKGWDWTELQERAYRRQRERDKNRLSVQETEELYANEIEALKERIVDLENQSTRNVEEVVSGVDKSSKWEQEAFSMNLPEIYEGEANDRIRYLLKTTIARADSLGIDRRSIVVAKALLDKNQLSSEFLNFRKQLQNVIKDPKKYSKEVTALMERYGYSQKSEKNHIRLQPQDDLEGLESITIVKTPSDHRSLKNQKAQIEKAIGVGNFS